MTARGGGGGSADARDSGGRANSKTWSSSSISRCSIYFVVAFSSTILQSAKFPDWFLAAILQASSTPSSLVMASSTSVVGRRG